MVKVVYLGISGDNSKKVFFLYCIHLIDNKNGGSANLLYALDEKLFLCTNFG